MANNTGNDAFTFDNFNGFRGGVGPLIQNDGSRGGMTRYNQGQESGDMNGGKDAKFRNSQTCRIKSELPS